MSATVDRGTPTSKLVRRIEFFGLAATFAKTPSTTSSGVLGRPDRGASATLPVAWNFLNSLPTVVCYTGSRSGCLRLNSAATSLLENPSLPQRRISSTRSSVVNIFQYCNKQKHNPINEIPMVRDFSDTL